MSQTVTDATLPAKVAIGGLTAGTQYYYRVSTAGGAQDSGTFKTLAAPGQSTGVRIGVFGDWRQELSPYPAIVNAPGRQLDAALKLGDTIYADYPSPNVPVAQATTLAEYRAKHSEALSARNGLNAFAAVDRTTNTYATIDDHEVTNDFAGRGTVGSDQRFTGAPGQLINGIM